MFQRYQSLHQQTCLSNEKHTGLIVRVWGFSSFFNDLPEDYKKVLIKRALKNEGKAA